MSNECLFCKIIAGEIPSKQEHQDEQCVVFHDIHPKAQVHLLVVPKKHIATIMELEEGDEPLMGHLIQTAKVMGEKLGLEGYRLQFNVGEKGGQVVMHVHLHVMGG